MCSATIDAAVAEAISALESAPAAGEVLLDRLRDLPPSSPGTTREIEGHALAVARSVAEDAAWASDDDWRAYHEAAQACWRAFALARDAGAAGATP